MTKRSNIKLTNADVDKRLEGSNFRRIGDYIGANIPIEFQCIVCNYIRNAAPSGIISGKNGCPKCNKKARITNNDIDLYLQDKQIIRLGDCINATTPIRFQCLIDNNIWPARPSLIINQNTGCPECARRKTSERRQITQSEVDERLKPINIKRLGKYINTATKIPFECLICSHKWDTLPNSLLNDEIGCPECARNARKLTNKELDDFLIGKNIKRVDNVIDSETHIHFACLLYPHVWEAVPKSIIHSDSGCPECAIKAKTLTNEDIDKRLIGLNIVRLGEYINNTIPIEFQCSKCHSKWETTAYSIYGHGNGCPKCDLSQAEQLIDAILKSNNIDFVNQKKIRELDNSYPNKHKVDFYINPKNLIIEYNGTQHYKPVKFRGCTDQQAEINFQKQVNRDRQVEQFCKDNNIKLIWIDGRIYKKAKLEQYITESILPLCT